MSTSNVLLLPGLMCDRAVWEGQLAALTGRFACTVADYGEADSIEEMAEVALRGLPPGPLSVAGHSMGGRVALELVRRVPQRIARLALLDTGYEARPAGEIGQEEARKRQRLLDLARAQGMRVMGREWVQRMVHPARLTDTVLIEAILAMIERKSPEVFAAQIGALLNRPGAQSLLERIACPTLVLCGREDAWSPLARHETMARAIRGASLVIVEDSGHMSTMEQPEAVTAALLEWLERE